MLLQFSAPKTFSLFLESLISSHFVQIEKQSGIDSSQKWMAVNRMIQGYNNTMISWPNDTMTRWQNDTTTQQHNRKGKKNEIDERKESRGEINDFGRKYQELPCDCRFVPTGVNFSLPENCGRVLWGLASMINDFLHDTRLCVGFVCCN